MIEAKNRFKVARQRVEALLSPIRELVEAAALVVAEAEREAEEAQVTLEALRPVWAQGWTSDSVAAQASANALSELWVLLGVTDQTQAVARLRDLLTQQHDRNGRNL